ncbi:ribonuclease HIII [Candidatus Poribacteria bacterium]|nr:ribonuclease HIII [Candidatus Poribacteria bacterium]
MNDIHSWNEWIGTDEAGKGDYFGPLVVAGVYVNADCQDEFLSKKITDGKKISNPRVRKLADWIWKHYEQHIVIKQKMPEDYNSLYEILRKRDQNLNTMLAKLHIESIQTLANRMGAKHALIDKFANNDIITPQLAQQDIEIKQETKAERDIAVAAASIIARDAFLKGIETLSQRYKIRLPRGAYQVTDAGKEFIKLHGAKALRNVAKLHFRTTETVLA